LSTSFGVFITPNITPDKETGIGLWNQQDFWQALHQGKSRDGRLLYPAFPYTEYTKVTRQDADAIFAYLQSLPPVSQANTAHDIFFPYNSRALLAVWRTLYFKEGVYEPDQSKSAAWNRGAYLVQGLGHCSACHTTRNMLGASQDSALTGGQIMGMNWYAPSLSSYLEAGSDDSIRGNNGNDTLFGGDGDDKFLVSGSGDGLDTIHGGNGTDTWLGSSGNDYFYVSGTSSNLQNLNSIEVINGGTNGYDRIVGSSGADTIDFSLATSPSLIDIDEIDGGSGNDTITVSNALATNYRGSAGNDIFVVTTSSAQSTILDFDDSGNDVIDLSDFGLTFAQIQALSIAEGADVRIDLTSAAGSEGAGTGDIILVGTTLASLDSSDFIV
jgi:Ca2+-binding RTX toxin-like protein